MSNVQIAATVPPSVYDEVSELAEAEERSIANVLRRAIRRELAEAEKAGQLMRDGKARTAKRKRLATA